MVTKQQQLEWMSKAHKEWPFILDYICMSSESVGNVSYAVGSHRIAKQEWQQERDKMQKQDNSWHEHGELPPVGCECEWIDKSGVDCSSGVKYPTVGDVVYVCAHRKTPRGNIAAIFTWTEDGYGLSVAASKMASDFRPLRTEREKAIDEMVKVLIGNDDRSAIQSAAVHTAESLYDAGYRKEQSK